MTVVFSGEVEFSSHLAADLLTREAISQVRDIGGDGIEGAALAAIPRAAIASSPELQTVWYSLQLRRWSSLALVAPERTEATAQLAHALAEIGTRAKDRPVAVVDCTRLDLHRAASVGRQLSPETGAQPSSQLILPVDSPIENPIALGVLGACDLVVLVLRPGETRLPAAKRIVELLGRDRIAGAILVTD